MSSQGQREAGCSWPQCFQYWESATRCKLSSLMWQKGAVMGKTLTGQLYNHWIPWNRLPNLFINGSSKFIINGKALYIGSRATAGQEDMTGDWWHHILSTKRCIFHLIFLGISFESILRRVIVQRDIVKCGIISSMVSSF